MELLLPMAGYPMKFRALVRYRDGLRHGFEFLALTIPQRDEIQPSLRDACNGHVAYLADVGASVPLVQGLHQPRRDAALAVRGAKLRNSDAGKDRRAALDPTAEAAVSTWSVVVQSTSGTLAPTLRRSLPHLAGNKYCRISGLWFI